MIKCYSVRLRSLRRISAKCFLATAFDGSEDTIPASQVYGLDLDVSKSEAYWITGWILKKKTIQYSRKKWSMFTKDGRNIGQIVYEHHVPTKITDKPSHDDDLFRATTAD